MIHPQELLEFAQSLLGSGEVSDRAAASRAYYAAFHACQTQYTSLGSHEGAGMHRAFIEDLKNSSTSADRSFGFMLDDIYRRRIEADYKLNSTFDTAQATAAVNGAERVLNKVSSV